MSKLFQERVLLAAKAASIFFATMLVILIGTMLIQDVRNAKPMDWSQPASEEGPDDNTGPKWWQGAGFKPADWPQQQPALGPAAQPQPWTPVTPDQGPVQAPSKPPAQPAPRTALP